MKQLYYGSFRTAGLVPVSDPIPHYSCKGYFYVHVDETTGPYSSGERLLVHQYDLVYKTESIIQGYIMVISAGLQN